MKWNSKTRKYEGDQGRTIPNVRIRRWLEEYIDANKDEIGTQAKAMLAAGASDVEILSFFESMRERVKTMHGTAGIVAYGGESEMNPERWARVGEKVVTQFEYLSGFETSVSQARRVTDQIIQTAANIAPSVESGIIEQTLLTSAPTEAVAAIESLIEAPLVVEPYWDSLIWGEVDSRARSYADATYSTWSNSEKAREMDAGTLLGRRVTESDNLVCEDCQNAATEEFIPLEEILDIGDSICTVNCRCEILFSYEGIEPIEIERETYA